MGTGIIRRSDLINFFNATRFTLRHYAKGFHPVSRIAFTAMSVNRMFFPLKNPGGEANYIADPSRKYVLVPGKMYFVPAFLPACFHLDCDLYFLSVQANLEIFPGVELFSACPRMLELSSPPEFEPLMKIFDSDDPRSLYQNAVRVGSLACSMLVRMMDHYDPEDFQKPISLYKYAALTDYLDRHGTALTSVSDLSSVLKTTRENFTRRFIAETGITPKQLIDRFVIGRCLNLIQQGNSFKEIAEKLHFRDVFAFSRYFRRIMGESPRDWRTHWNGGKVPAFPGDLPLSRE
ncbi:MAG: helix-turn-helix transcriptional regulator [Lentisphaeria bacterium]|nr:helix-turn-helix transcriptional regulator [Lentisphaeria bacterium]